MPVECLAKVGVSRQVVRDGVLAFQQPGKGSYHDIVEERFEFWEYYRRPVLLTGWG
jgi:hypothetical protein